MKRLFIFSLAFLVTFLIAFFALKHSSQAWVQVSKCRLHAYPPTNYHNSGYVVAWGTVDTCGGFTHEAHIQIEVCLQVRHSNGRWTTTNRSCGISSDHNALSIIWSSNPLRGVPGHKNRTWAWARVNGIQHSMVSSVAIFR